MGEKTTEKGRKPRQEHERGAESSQKQCDGDLGLTRTRQNRISSARECTGRCDLLQTLVGVRRDEPFANSVAREEERVDAGDAQERAQHAWREKGGLDWSESEKTTRKGRGDLRRTFVKRKEPFFP